MAATHLHDEAPSACICRSLEIECVPEELENDHLPELKTVIEETNQAYAKYAEGKIKQREADAAREAASVQQLKDLKNRIKFD